MRRGAAATARAVGEQATATEQIAQGGRGPDAAGGAGLARDGRTDLRRERRSATRRRQHAAADRSRPPRPLAEQSRAIKDMADGRDRRVKQIKLIAARPTEHSAAAQQSADAGHRDPAHYRSQRRGRERNARQYHRDLVAQAQALTRSHGRRGQAPNGAQGARTPSVRIALTARWARPADIGIFTTDTALVVRTWDALARRRRPASRATPRIGRPLSELVPELEARGFLQRFHDVLTSGTVQVLAPALHHYLIACPPRCRRRASTEMQQRVTIGPLRDGDDDRRRDRGDRGRHRAPRSRTRSRRGAGQPRSRARRAAAEAIAAAGADRVAHRVRARARGRQLAGAAGGGPAGWPSSADAAFIAPWSPACARSIATSALLSSALKLLAVTDVDVTAPLVGTAARRGPRPAYPGARWRSANQQDPAAVAPLIEALRDPRRQRALSGDRVARPPARRGGGRRAAGDRRVA